MKIDKKDKRILYELDRNSRQSLSMIGKSVGLPKNVVAYRIKRLENLGIIKNYYTVVDASKLGYFSIRFYLTYQYTTPSIETEIIDYFKNNPYTWWVATTEPIHNLAVIIWVKEVKDFYIFWEKTLKKYGHYFQCYNYSIYIEAVHYKYEYLMDKKYKEEKPDIIGGNKKTDVDKFEMKILQIMANNARIPITEIASKLTTTPKIIQYRVKRLLQNNIISGFRTNINLEKIGYINYRLNYYLSDYAQIKRLETYVIQNPSLIYINRTIGYADLECEHHFTSLNQLHDFIDDIKEKFPHLIRNYNYFLFKKVHKEQFMIMDNIEL